MILIDLNQVLLSGLMAQISGQKNVNLEEDLIRHLILNILRNHIKNFKSDYGEVVLCCDNRKYWRKDFFPFYKASRKKNREKSNLDWNLIFNMLAKFKDELKENFPYKVIDVEGAEADDIISTLVSKFGSELNIGEKILILSGDKDFIQLHKYEYVKQYDPTRKKWIKHEDPELFLEQHILKGDSGDGIPNVLSSDNCFVVGERQKPLTQKKIDALIELGIAGKFDHPNNRNYMRNFNLIDLRNTPDDIHNKVMDSYNAQEGKDRSKLMNYFISNRLKNLTEHISEF